MMLAPIDASMAADLHRTILEFVENDLPRYDTWPHRTGPHIIAADPHVPCHSTLWCNRLLSVARATGIKSLILAGDVLDMASFSAWGADPDISWSTEMDLAAEWLWVIYHNFDDVLWIGGNHEGNRIARITARQMKFPDLVWSILCRYAENHNVMVLVDPHRIKASAFPACLLDTDWLVTHPKSYSRIPLRVANQLALIQQKNVVAAHSHFGGQGQADNGLTIIDSGGLFDESKIRYRWENVTTHRKWSNGFVVYAGGYAEFFGPTMDWRPWGG